MAQSGQQQGQQDNSMWPIWVVCAFFVFFAGLWYLEHTIIVRVVFAIKLFEISIIDLFTTKLIPLQQFMRQANPESINIKQLVAISRVVGSAMSIPIAVFFLLMAFILYRSNTKSRFRTIHSMSSLAEQEKLNWPYIVPVLGLDLVNESIDEGPWAMTTPPMRFAKQYKLLKEEKPIVDDAVLSRNVHVKVTVKHGKAGRLFAKQLGKPWEDIWKLPPYIRALFAIFAAKAEGDRAPAVALLRQIAASASHYPIKVDQLDFKGADDLLRKHEKSKIVGKVLSQHAYMTTVMASMIEIARLDGVLASAEFLWLKPVDRTLWYVLNTVGRQTAPCEVAGIFAHWLAERRLGKAMLIPMVEEASFALESAISELIYIPDEK
jgi:intracellular multiplication protein IcmP